MGLTACFEILHTTTENDKMDLVLSEVWKGHTKTKYIIAYNPPNNITDKLETLETDRSTILIRDCNAHQMGYRDICRFGESLEEYIDNQPLLLLDMITNPKNKYIPIKHWKPHQSRLSFLSSVMQAHMVKLIKKI
jgi:hypothetical protein